MCQIIGKMCQNFIHLSRTVTAVNPVIKGSWGWGSHQRPSLVSNQRAWLVWAVSAIFVLFQFYAAYFGEIVAGLMHSYRLNAFYAGLLASSYYYIYTLLQAPAGLLVDRFGARRLLTLGACGLSVGCLIFGNAGHPLTALLGRLLMGASASFAFVGYLNLISNWFEPRRFGMMMSIAEVFGMLGSALGGLGLATIICIMVGAGR